jgi:hypothetical protein
MGGREMSDTPETDAARHDLSDYGSPVLCSWGDWVDADFARKLERERDEAREALENLKASLDQIASLYESNEMTATVDQRISDAYDMRCIARQAIDQLKESAK